MGVWVQIKHFPAHRKIKKRTSELFTLFLSDSNQTSFFFKMKAGTIVSMKVVVDQCGLLVICIYGLWTSDSQKRQGVPAVTLLVQDRHLMT